MNPRVAKLTLPGNQRTVLIAHATEIATAKAAYESAAGKARDQAKARWRRAVNKVAKDIAARFGSIEWIDDIGGTENALALISFFHFQGTSDECLIAGFSTQLSSVLERLLASRPAWATK